jgi:NADH dehydrogenase
VSREPVLQIRPRLYEADPNDLAVELLGLLGRIGVEFVAGEVSKLDVSNRTIRLRTSDTISYARLVVATGSTMHRPKVPGAELAHSIDTQRDAIVFDERLAQIVLCSRGTSATGSGRPTVATKAGNSVGSTK